MVDNWKFYYHHLVSRDKPLVILDRQIDNLETNFIAFENEKAIAYNAGNIYMKGVVDKFGSQALAQANGAWNYGVYAVNLTVPGTGAVAQDGLIYVPDGGMTLMLLGVGLGGLALTGRRARR